jgi:hypothetical protein
MRAPMPDTDAEEEFKRYKARKRNNAKLRARRYEWELLHSAGALADAQLPGNVLISVLRFDK